jgi:hypothetical protein
MDLVMVGAEYLENEDAFELAKAEHCPRLRSGVASCGNTASALKVSHQPPLDMPAEARRDIPCHRQSGTRGIRRVQRERGTRTIRVCISSTSINLGVVDLQTWAVCPQARL